MAVLLAAGQSLVAQFTELGAPRCIPRDTVGSAVAVVDVDGDGDLDVLTGSDRPLLRNDGLACFEIDRTLDLTGAGALAAGDLDGDGDVDVVCSRYPAPGVLLNDGTGSFRPHAGISFVRYASVRLLLVDADRDGDLDLLDNGAAWLGASLYLNDGSANFANADARLPSGGVAWHPLAVADVDRDGDADVFGVGNDDVLSIWINDGGRRLTHEPGRVPAGLLTAEVAVGDVDGDGHVDCVTQSHVLLNQRTGTFVDATASLLPPGTTGDPALADMDGDGDLDLLLAPGRAQQLRLYLNDGRGRFTEVTGSHVTPVPSPGSVPLAADLDGDGDRDVLVGRGPPRLYRNLGRARLRHAEPPDSIPIGTVPTTPSSLVLADFDGDRLSDVVVASTQTYGYAPSRCVLLRNDGLGGFVVAPLPAAPGNTTRLRVADLDRDGDLDLLQACALPTYWPLDGRDWIYWNRGGTFVLQGLGALQDETHGITAADVDGDGDLDVLTANVPNGQDRGQNRLYENVGGAFVEVTPRLPVDQDRTREIVAGDVDGDGDVDLVCANDLQDRLYLNDGTSRFTDATAGRLPPDSEAPSTALLADFDSDGDLDLMIVVIGQSRLLSNDGRGRFVDATASRMPVVQHRSRDAAILDADHDGDGDVLLVGERVASLLLVNGGGTFAIAPLALPGDDRPNAATAGDIDGDEDTDILFADAATGRYRAYSNLTRQLHIGKPLQQGRELPVDIYAFAGNATRTQLALPWLGFGLAPVPVTVHPWGVFRLDPQPVVALPPTILPPPTGRARLLLPGLSSAQFAGVAFYFQALVLHTEAPRTWRLGNVAPVFR